MSLPMSGERLPIELANVQASDLRHGDLLKISDAEALVKQAIWVRQSPTVHQKKTCFLSLGAQALTPGLSLQIFHTESLSSLFETLASPLFTGGVPLIALSARTRAVMRREA